MSESPSASGSAGSRRGKLRTFWERVTEGIQISELWSQFQAEARTSYGLYSREVDWDEIQKKKRWRRPLHAAWALFVVMLMKLSPARRILFLIAAVFLLYPTPALLVLMFSTDRFGALEDIKLFVFGTALLFVLLALELADRVTMKRDLEIAREIQRWLVPEKPLAVPGYDIAFLTRAANTVAGDYYDTIPRGAARGSATPASPLLLVVADVAGKSVPAALLMATFQASLRAIEATGCALAELVRGLNDYVCENSQTGLRFITAFLAELDPLSGDIEYTSAGHLPALIRRASGEVIELREGGIPLGIEREERFPSGQARLAPGEILFIHTDGVVEAVNAQGEEFGRGRLLNVLAPCDAANPAADILEHITHVLDGFVGQARQHDDLTCMVIRRDRAA